MNHRFAVPLGAALLVALGALSGCNEHFNTSGSRGTLTIDDTAVRIRVPGESDAYVHQSGRLVIGQHAVALTPAEQTLAQRYYQDALGISAAGLATGKAGGRLGADIVGSLFAAIWQDDSSVIERTAHQGSARLRADIRSLCTQLANLEGAQDALATAVPAFAPYRIVDRNDVEHCVSGAARHADHTN